MSAKIVKPVPIMILVDVKIKKDGVSSKMMVSRLDVV